jgi:hypothetical protein
MIVKHFMAQKTLDMWRKYSEDDMYKGCPIEIDNSIPYGAVEHEFIRVTVCSLKSRRNET